MSGDRLEVSVTFDPVKGYVATLPEAGPPPQNNGSVRVSNAHRLAAGFSYCPASYKAR
jgi:hypothetical protein